MIQIWLQTELEGFKKSYSRCTTRTKECDPEVSSHTRSYEHWSEAVLSSYNFFEDPLNWNGVEIPKRDRGILDSQPYEPAARRKSGFMKGGDVMKD